MRYVTPATVFFSTMLIACGPYAAAAQELPPVLIATASTVPPTEMSKPALADAGILADQAMPISTPDIVWATTLHRPKILPMMYSSFIALQAYDGYATTRGVARGATEANPLLGSLATRPALFWSVKGGVTLGGIYLSERLWKSRRRTSAIAVMVLSNTLMSVVAAKTSAVLRDTP